KTISLLFIISLFINGAVTDEVESVSVMEGDSVTLHTNIVIQTDDLIEWRYGAQLDLIAKLNREANKISLYNDTGGRFTDRLMLNDQTGDLTIIDVRSELEGVYQLEITGKKVTTKTFRFSVFGDADEGKSVSVMDGDSVTLHADVPDIKKFDVIRWRFQRGSSFLAELNRKTSVFPKYDVSDGRFTDRLQLDLTGSLTITSIRIKHSGHYDVDISSITHTIHRSYTVTVGGEVKSVSVMEGDSVTLHTDFTHIQRYDKVEWRFGTSDTPIAKINKDVNLTSVYVDVLEGRFRDRLQVDDQTGSLTINNIETDLSGLYELKIINRRRSIQRRFIVTVGALGLSSGVVAGICVTVSLLIAAAAAAAVSYIRRCFPKARTLEVMEGDPVTLHTDFIVKPDDVIKWRFGLQRTLIAEIRSPNGTTCNDVLDGRFSDRLTQSPQSGSLTISDTRTTDSGVYQLKIISSNETSYKRFRLTVTNSNRVNETGPLMNGDIQLQ
ncbi:hypothetical protein IRJ41_025917, partial [Triplophysa rosa]